jgi:hypothetical protein
MRAIVINAKDRTITETEIDSSLKSLQHIVGGLIEPVYQGLDESSPAMAVILASAEDGAEAPCTLPLDW